MPKSTKAVMRAATRGERVTDKVRDVYESLAEQPLAKLADMLGLSDLGGVVESFTTPDDGVRMGVMPIGPPGAGILSKIGRPGAPGISRGFLNKRTSYRTQGAPGATPTGMRHRGEGGYKKAMNTERRIERGLEKSQNRNSMMGDAMPAEARRSHPALPNDFQEIVAPPKKPYGKTTPIDMGNLPSGTMQYMDPDVADFMNPAPIDTTTLEGQRRLQAMLALMGKR